MIDLNAQTANSSGRVRAKFNQYSVDPTCLLCGENPEDHGHFLLRCRSLTESRDPFIKTIKSVLSQYLGDEEQHCTFAATLSC